MLYCCQIELSPCHRICKMWGLTCTFACNFAISLCNWVKSWVCLGCWHSRKCQKVSHSLQHRGHTVLFACWAVCLEPWRGSQSCRNFWSMMQSWGGTCWMVYLSATTCASCAYIHGNQGLSLMPKWSNKLELINLWAIWCLRFVNKWDSLGFLVKSKNGIPTGSLN